ncbi:MAG: hypothetical protein MRERV_1c014 [Mycoplasmataceae bacterium RV_VA103A]|nr:MAG: hypothetical protein MRERV_1c014 [Mycoplasmataceae bacterium RV_VA103A]
MLENNRESLRKLVSEVNKESNYFVFKETDLKRIDKSKFSITSPELKNSLSSLLGVNTSFPSNIDFPNR